MNGLVCMVALAVATQAAKQQPLVAVHPLEISGVSASALEEVSDDFFVELSRQPVDLVTRYEIDQALAAKRCTGGYVPCLGRLAEATGAKLALWASIHIDAESYRVQAKLVDPAGKPVREGADVTIPKDLTQPRSPQVRAAFKSLFAQLSMDKEPEVKTVAPLVAQPAPAPPAATEVAPEPPAVAQSSSPLKPLGLVAGGLAVGAGLAAAGLGAWNAVTAGQIRSGADADGNIQLMDVGRAADVKRNTAIAIGLGVGAGVLAVLSAVLLLTSTGDDAVSLGAAPLPGGAHVMLSAPLP